MAIVNTDGIKKKISYVVALGMLTAFVSAGTAVASPEDTSAAPSASVAGVSPEGGTSAPASTPAVFGSTDPSSSTTSITVPIPTGSSSAAGSSGAAGSSTPVGSSSAVTATSPASAPPTVPPSATLLPSTASGTSSTTASPADEATGTATGSPESSPTPASAASSQAGAAPIIGIDAAQDTLPSLDMPTTDRDSDVDTTQIPNSGSTSQLPQAINPEPMTPGTAVPHDFDVVVANIYPSTSQFPSGPAAQQVDQNSIGQVLKGAASWWSDQTELSFAFNFDPTTRLHYINTTCADLNRDALAAFDLPLNARPYTVTEAGNNPRDLLILEARQSCGNYSGLALTVAYPGSVFAGGIFRMAIGAWTGGSQFDMYSAIVAHEFGHTIGLLHSNIRDCAGLGVFGDDNVGFSWDGSYLMNLAGCTTREYGDTETIMSAVSSLTGVTLNSLQRWYLGVVREDWTMVVDQDTDLTKPIVLGRAELADTGLKRGIVVPYPGETFTIGLGIEYRWPRDQFDMAAGVYLTSALAYEGFQTDVMVPVVGTQGSVTSIQQPLNEGDVAVSADGRIRVEVVSLTETQAEVKLSYGTNPGVDGKVAITRVGNTLNAVPLSSQATNITYQWFRNGDPIDGVTGASYAPPLSDPNAVYRVEATMTAPGRGPTTRYSRGIMADPQRMSIVGNTAILHFLDQNGEPRQCFGGTMATSVYTMSDDLVFSAELPLIDGGSLGVCQIKLDLPLTGTFRVEAEFADGGPQTPIDWLMAFWAPTSATWYNTAPGSTATLFVGQAQYVAMPLVPRLAAGVDAPPLPVMVAVTDSNGAPLPGVSVTFDVPSELMLLTDDTVVTNESGFASTQVAWNTSNALQVPETSLSREISATIPGIAQVQGSPASVTILGNDSSGRLEGRFQKTTAAADGVDALKLYIRAWDEDGSLVVNQPDRIEASFQAKDQTGTKPQLSDPVWDDNYLGYVVTITSNAPVVGGAVIVVLTDGVRVELSLDPVLSFVPGPAAGIKGESVPGFAVVGNGCKDSRTPTSMASVALVDGNGNWIIKNSLGIVFSFPPGSPLTALTSNLMVTPDARGQYNMMFTAAVSGVYSVTATPTDDSYPPITIPVSVGNDSIDAAGSTVTVSSGTRMADGSQAHMVTATLVSQCGAPMTNLAGDGKWLTTNITTSNGNLSKITASNFVEDSTKPGTYTATITSTQSGTYGVTVQVGEHPDSPSNDQGVDVVTNVNASPLRIVYNTAPPVNAAVPQTDPTNGSLITGTAEPGVTVRVRDYTAGNVIPGCEEILVPQSGAFSCTPTSRLADQTRLGVTATGTSNIPSDAFILLVQAPFATVISPIQQGASERIVGHNFNPGESVTAVVGNNALTLGPATADAAGTVTFSAFTVGSSFTPGTYSVVVTGETTGSVVKSLTVTAGSTTSPTTGPTSSSSATASTTPTSGSTSTQTSRPTVSPTVTSSSAPTSGVPTSSPTSTLTSPATSITTAPTSAPVTSTARPTSNPTNTLTTAPTTSGSPAQPSGPTSTPTGSMSNPTTGPASSTTSTTGVTTGATSTTGPTQTQTTGPASSTTGPTKPQTSAQPSVPASSAPTETSPTSAPTSGLTSAPPTSPTASSTMTVTSAPPSTGPTSTAVVPPSKSAVGPSGVPTSTVSATPSAPTGGTTSRNAGMVFLGLLAVLGGFVLLRSCRTSR